MVVIIFIPNYLFIFLNIFGTCKYKFQNSKNNYQLNNKTKLAQNNWRDGISIKKM